MAPSVTLKHCCLLLALLSVSSFCCQAQDPANIVAEALLCFSNVTIYKECAEQYRLTANGTLNVPRNATDAFCSGACLAETQLILHCIDAILSNFKFYNGATIQAVNTTLLIACGNTTRRGDFNVTENIVGATIGQGIGRGSSHVRALGLWVTSLLMVLITVL